jgi:sulfur carrier protein ThiS
MTNTNIKTVKVGVMPGRLNEFAVAEGSSIASVLELAGLNASGFEVKVDSITTTDLEGTKVTSSTNLILLAKQVKGNAGGVVKIGVMPGRLNEFALPATTTIKEALAHAELDASGYEVKVDSVTVTNFDAPIGEANLILLAKQVKGNAGGVIKIGVMPGRLNEFALPPETTIAQALEHAELSASGFEVKVDSVTVTDFSQPIGSANLILLAKQVKGN